MRPSSSTAPTDETFYGNTTSPSTFAAAALPPLAPRTDCAATAPPLLPRELDGMCNAPWFLWPIPQRVLLKGLQTTPPGNHAATPTSPAPHTMAALSGHGLRIGHCWIAMSPACSRGAVLSSLIAAPSFVDAEDGEDTYGTMSHALGRDAGGVCGQALRGQALQPCRVVLFL